MSETKNEIRFNPLLRKRKQNLVKIKNQLILTCNPTGPNLFYKNFINNETDK